MKIKKLEIESYRHLDNISLNFTYPDGHGKAGQPLDKICLIGQSATGKTSILELIKNGLLKLVNAEVINGTTRMFNSYNLALKGEIEFLYNGKSLTVRDEFIIIDGIEYTEAHSGGGAIGHLIDKGDAKLIYFSSEMISGKTIQIFNQNPLNILSALSEGKQFNSNQNYLVYEFTEQVDENIWFSLFKTILDYRKKFTQMASELINKGTIGDLNRLNQEFINWSKVNKNPLIPFAELFNPILNKLNLEIDLINTEYVIPIKSKNNDELIPISALSTGTKGLLLSFFPLFEFDSANSIILIDEPERSLFPDLQTHLISYYQSFAPSAQIITATHSPFIAAAFEPEERFILYYDSKGKVKVRQGEAPIGDDPNDMLRNDFKVDFYNSFGKEAYQRYLDLKRKMVQETEPDKKKALLIKLTELGDKYNF